MDKFELGEIIAKVVRVKGGQLHDVNKKAQEVLTSTPDIENIEEELMAFFERSDP